MNLWQLIYITKLRDTFSGYTLVSFPFSGQISSQILTNRFYNDIILESSIIYYIIYYIYIYCTDIQMLYVMHLYFLFKTTNNFLLSFYSNLILIKLYLINFSF